MKGVGVIKSVAVWAAVLGLCLPQAAMAAGPPVSQAPIVTDVALQEGGVLVGQVLDLQSAAVADVPVVLRSQDQEPVVGTTNADGQFSFVGLHGGVYQVVAARGHGAYRLWTPGTAPPTAQQGALVIAGSDAVRGQGCGGGCGGCGCLKFWLCNPWVICGIVATAVAIPVGLHNADDGPTSP